MTTTAEELTVSPLALVTGASSGIGAAFAERLAADGYDLIVVGRREGRLRTLAASLAGVTTEVLVADLATDAGIDIVADVCATRPLTMLVNNAGVAHYMPMADLPAEKACELLHVKVVAPAMLTRSALAGMLTRGSGTIINVAGMLAFAGPAPAAPPQGQRAIYVGSLAGTVAMTQTLHAELAGTGVSAHVVCPGSVATEFHEVQGMDLSAVPRMSAADVVTAALAGIGLGEVVTAPGVQDTTLLSAVFTADLAAFGGQSPHLAERYQARPGPPEPGATNLTLGTAAPHQIRGRSTHPLGEPAKTTSCGLRSHRRRRPAGDPVSVSDP